jgi:uncharacterized protein YkwD
MSVLIRFRAPAFLATILLLAVWSASARALRPPASAAGDCTVDATMDSEETAFLALINAHRQQNGLAKLAPSYALTRAAAWKSKDLGENAYFAHDDLARTWVQRVRDCGYGFNTYIGENIAAGVQTAQQAFDLWKNSPGHNANMLGANYTSIGIGRYYVSGSPYGWYWTTEFAGYDDGWSTIAAPSQPVVLTPPGPEPRTADAPPSHRRAHRPPSRRSRTGAAASVRPR